jgi:hypothetical protein
VAQWLTAAENRSGGEAPALGAGNAAEGPTRRTMQGELDSEI